MARVPFETTAESRERGLRADDGRAVPLKYRGSSGILPVLGDDVAPYHHALGKASVNANAGLIEVADGEGQRLAVDPRGVLWTRSAEAGAAAQTAKNASAADSLVVKSSPGRLFQIRVILDAAVAADRFLQVHAATSAPSDGTAPVWEAFVPGALSGANYAQAADDFEPISGLALSPGIVLALSSTPGTLTITTASEGFFVASYA